MAKCLRKVSEKSSVRKGAKCLIEARDRAKANRFYEGCNDPKTGYILCDTYEKSFITVDDNIDVGTHRKPTKREVLKFAYPPHKTKISGSLKIFKSLLLPKYNRSVTEIPISNKHKIQVINSLLLTKKSKY